VTAHRFWCHLVTLTNPSANLQAHASASRRCIHCSADDLGSAVVWISDLAAFPSLSAAARVRKSRRASPYQSGRIVGVKANRLPKGAKSSLRSVMVEARAGKRELPLDVTASLTERFTLNYRFSLAMFDTSGPHAGPAIPAEAFRASLRSKTFRW
jgi:hypothetical protein